MATQSKIGARTVIVGNVHGDGDLEILGRVSGDITVEGNVLVASGAVVKGAISAAVIRVAGSVEGNLDATDTISIEPDAQMLGDLTTPRVSIAEGATVRGMLRTEGGRNAREQRGNLAATPKPGSTNEVTAARHEARPLPAMVDHSDSQPDVEPPPDSEPRKKGKHKDKRPPEPKVPALAKGTKGKKKGDKR